MTPTAAELRALADAPMTVAWPDDARRGLRWAANLAEAAIAIREESAAMQARIAEQDAQLIEWRNVARDIERERDREYARAETAEAALRQAQADLQAELDGHKEWRKVIGALPEETMFQFAERVGAALRQAQAMPPEPATTAGTDCWAASAAPRDAALAERDARIAALFTDSTKDKIRLDYLDKEASSGPSGAHICCLPGSLRAAIDAAIRESKPA